MLAMVGGMPGGGTRYMTEVLQACGINAMHEIALRNQPEILRQHNHDVEVSWLCTEWFKVFSGPKFLVVRPPLNVIRSMYSWRFLQYETMPNTYLGANYPALCDMEGIRKLCRFYIDWMTTGARFADYIWDVREISQSHINTISQKAKIKCNPTGVDTIKGKVNSKHHYWFNVQFDWSQLDDMWPELISVCDRLGIEVGYGDLAVDKALS